MKTLLNIKLHLSKKNIFTILVFILVLGGTTGCIQHKSDQKRLPALSFTVNGESFEMIPVEGGTFIMGGTSEQGNDCENNEKPTHEETLPFFYIGKYEVTQKLWKAVMGTDFDQSYNSGCEDCPAEYISWNDTQKFISKLNTLTNKTFRLPTDIEWEYAARGGKYSEKYKYSGSNDIDEVAWYIENYQKSKYGDKGTTHPVGMKNFYFRIADKCNIIDKPNERSSHTRITLRGGGIIFYLGALAYFLTNQFEYPWFMLALTLITFISFVDDIRSTSQGLRLVFHFTAMALMFYQWGLFSLPWWTILVALIVCTGIINAYNFMDGINGITGGYSWVVLLALAFINVQIVRFVEEDLIYTMLCAVLVFNFFNFRKKAKCFAGDVGSVSIAFVILFLIGKLIIRTENFSWIILLVVYGVDSVLTIIHRLMLHENIGLPHRKHLYQLMANELEIPHVVVSLIYMTSQAIIIVGYLLTPGWGYCYLLGTIVILSIVYILFMKKYFHLHPAMK